MSYHRAFATVASVASVAGLLSLSSDRQSLEATVQTEERKIRAPREFLPLGYKDVLCSLGEQKYPVHEEHLDQGSVVLSTVDRYFFHGDEQFDSAIAFFGVPPPERVHFRLFYAGRANVPEDVALPLAVGINMHYRALGSEQKAAMRRHTERRYGMPTAQTVVGDNFHIEWSHLADKYILTLSNSVDEDEIISFSMFLKGRTR